MAEITDPTLRAALRTFQVRNGELRKTIEGLGDAGINWIPGTETNSIFAVLWHAMDVERNSISNAALNPATVPPRDLTRKGTEAELLARLAETEGELESYIGQISDLNAEVQMYGRTTFAAQVLVNGVSHVTEHAAHAALTRQMWEQYGMSGVVKGVEA